MHLNNIEVSVICTVYNHEQFLYKTLEGFVKQNTSFKYEVIIHDDASTDNSKEIIREYELRYPEIICPIYQLENQYSKGVLITRDIMIPMAKGRYIAYCEGDDYWIDENKLQKQYDFLEKHQEYTICTHEAWRENCITHERSLVTKESKDREYSVDEIIKGGGSLFATASVFLRKEAVQSRPDIFYVKGVGDFQLVLYASICGKCYYFSQPMAVYSVGAQYSWSETVGKNVIKQIETLESLIRMLKNVDEYYQYKYHDAIQYRLCDWSYRVALLKEDWRAIKRKEYKEWYLKDRKWIIKKRIKNLFKRRKKEYK